MGACLIAPRRSNIAHLRWPWRANLPRFAPCGATRIRSAKGSKMSSQTTSSPCRAPNRLHLWAQRHAGSLELAPLAIKIYGVML